MPNKIAPTITTLQRRTFVHRHPVLTTFLAFIVSTAFVVSVAEIGFGFLNRRGAGEDRAWDYTPKDWIDRDSTGSARPRPLGTYRVRLSRHQDETIYDVKYNIDEHRRRMTPVESPAARDRHALFFADSFAYGEGVQETETLEYSVGSLAPQYMPYNYGFHGGSPLEMLAKLKSGDLKNEVPQRSGALVYLFIDDHVYRTAASMRYTMWDLHRPYFTVAADGQLVRDGDLTSGRPFLTRLYALLAKSEVLEHFQVDVPFRATAENTRFLARLLETSRNTYREQFPGSEFYVLIYPGERRFGPQLCAMLHPMQVPCIDYSELMPGNDRKEKYTMTGDGHPNAQAYQLLARHLVDDLQWGSRTAARLPSEPAPH